MPPRSGALAGRARRGANGSGCCRPRSSSGEADRLELPLSVPRGMRSASARASWCAREDGGVSEFELKLWELPQTGSIEMDGRHVGSAKRRACPSQLPLGYHEVTATVGGETATRYIVTPERAWTPEHLGRGGRAAGIAVSLYGVRSERNWGCGDFRDLLERDRLGGRGPATPVSSRSIRCTPSTTGGRSTPAPTCRTASSTRTSSTWMWRRWRISRARRRAQRFRAMRARSCAEIEDLRATPFVEYERVAALKLRFLKLLFAAVSARAAHAARARSREFDAFVAREGDLLEDFATYCALDEHLHRAQSRSVDVDRMAGRSIRTRDSRGDARVSPKTLALA